MTVFAPAWRARVYAPKSVDLTETTLLTPRAGALHSDAFRIATIQGVSGYQPIMGVPQGRRCRVDPKTKKADIGSRTVTLLDRLIDPATSLRTERWLTQFWGDETGKSALGMCRYEEDESFDDGATWTRSFTGRIKDLKTKGPVQATISIEDMMGVLEADVFQRDPLEGVDYSLRMPLLPNGLPVPFLGFGPGSPELHGEIIDGSPKQINSDANIPPADLNSLGLCNMLFTQRLVDLATSNQRIPFANLRIFTFPPKKVRLRLSQMDLLGNFTITWWWVDIISAVENKDSHWRTDRIQVSNAADLNDGAIPAWPANGIAVTWRLYYPEGVTSEKNPLVINTIDPVQLMIDVLDGLFGLKSASGDPMEAVARAPGSFEALLNTFPNVRFIITKEAKRRRWLTDEICQAFQLAISMNAYGQAILLDLRRGTAEGLPEITDAEIVAGTTTEGTSQEAGDAIRRIVAKIATVEQLTWLDIAEDDAEYPDPPAGLFRIVLADPPPVYDALGDPRAIDFGAAEVSISFLGLATLAQPSEPTPDLYIETTRRMGYVERYARDILDLDSHGAQYITLECRRVGIAESTSEGARRIISVSKLPNAGTLLRGGSRVGLCIERSENGPTVSLVFKDLGLTEVSDPPVLDPPEASVEDCAHTISIGVTLNADDERAVVEYAVTGLAEARPDDSSLLWQLGGYLTASGTLTISGLPSGSRIHLRARTEPSGAGPQPQPSEWVAPDPAFVDTCPLEGPDDCAVDGSIVSWTLTRLDLPIQIMVDAVVVASLPPGTTQWDATGWSGTVSVDQLDGFGGVVAGCSVAVDLEDVDCTEPIITDTRDDATNSLTVTIVDPQIKVSEVAFKTQTGSAPETDWVVSPGPYTVAVEVFPPDDSIITRRVTYTDCDGLVVEAIRAFVFTGLLPPDPPSFLDAVPIEIPLVTEARIWRDVGATIEPLGFGRQDWFPFDGFAAGRITATVRESTLSLGARLVIEYQEDDGTWVYAGDGGGPILAIDPASVLLYPDGVMKGLSVPLAEGMKSDRRWRLSSEGGDGTGYVIVERVAFQPTAQPDIIDPPETPEPPIVDPPPVEDPDPSSCDPDDLIPGDTWMTLIFDCRVTGNPATAVDDARGIVDPPDDYGGTHKLSGFGAPIVVGDFNGRDTVEFDGAGAWRIEGTGALAHPFGWGASNPASAELWAVVQVVGAGGLLATMLGPVEGTKIFPTSIESDFGSSIEHTIPLTGVDLSDGPHLLRIQATSRFKVWVDNIIVYDAPNTMFWITSSFPFGVDNGWMGSYGGNPPFASMRIARLDLMQGTLSSTAAAGFAAHLASRYALGIDGVITDPPDPGPQPPPPDPPPNPPPPITGGAIFGMEGIPNTGYPGGPWNSTIMRDITPSNAVAKFAAITGMQNFWMPQGPQGLYAPGGQFNIDLYVASVRRWLPPSAGRTAALAAIADGRTRYLFASDEPTHPGRWGPGGISLANARRMVAVLREVFPDCPVVIRCTPDTYSAVIPGLTDYWFTLKVNRGPISSVIPAMLAEAAALGCGLGCSMNCRDFNDIGGGVDASNNPSGWITPAQMRLYGLQLASYSALTFFHGWWMEDPEWYGVAGMAATEFDVRAAWIATHP